MLLSTTLTLMAEAAGNQVQSAHQDLIYIHTLMAQPPNMGFCNIDLDMQTGGTGD